MIFIVIHLFMVVIHKHTHYSGPGRKDSNVVGYPLMPVYVAKAGGFFFIVFGVIMLIAATFTINPIWNYGLTTHLLFLLVLSLTGTSVGWMVLLRLAPTHLEFVVGGYTWAMEHFASANRLTCVPSRCCCLPIR